MGSNQTISRARLSRTSTSSGLCGSSRDFRPSSMHRAARTYRGFSWVGGIWLYSPYRACRTSDLSRCDAAHSLMKLNSLTAKAGCPRCAMRLTSNSKRTGVSWYQVLKSSGFWKCSTARPQWAHASSLFCSSSLIPAPNSEASWREACLPFWCMTEADRSHWRVTKASWVQARRFTRNWSSILDVDPRLKDWGAVQGAGLSC